MTPPLADLAQRDTVRLISTGRLRPPALLPLAADEQALADLAALESATNERLRAEESGLPDLDRRELVFGRPGNSFINAAFTHVRPGGNRFNGEGRGAWYCAFERATAQREVGYHLGRELAAIGRFDNTTDYAELVADFIGPVHDLRGADRASEACLDPDPTIGYAAGQELGRHLRAEVASNGIVYPSARQRGGTCLVAFRPDLVQNLRQGGVWRMEWRGEREPRVTRVGE
jgi:RES domain-containing protein